MVIVLTGILGLLAGVLIGLLLGRDRARRAAMTLMEETAMLRGQLAAASDVDQAAQLRDSFAVLSQEALSKATEQLISLAEQRFSGDEKDRKATFQAEFQPVTDLLTQYQSALDKFTRNQQEQYTDIMGQVKGLKESSEGIQRGTSELTRALREPLAKGQWGELQLRRVVEFAGMVEHCDFDEQESTTTDEGRSRPDLIVNLPGGLRIIVDAKFPFSAYSDIAGAQDESERRKLTTDHGRQVKAHIDALAKRNYQGKIETTAPFVVIFLPADPILGAALEAEPTLYDYALERGVLPASPTTLIALLHSASYAWRNDTLAQEAEEVRKLGAELYNRLSTMSGHLQKVQRGLASTVGSFNELVGSLEQRVLISARRFREFGVVGDAKEIVEVPPIDALPREISVAEMPENVSELRSAEGEI